MLLRPRSDGVPELLVSTLCGNVCRHCVGTVSRALTGSHAHTLTRSHGTMVHTLYTTPHVPPCDMLCLLVGYVDRCAKLEKSSRNRILQPEDREDNAIYHMARAQKGGTYHYVEPMLVRC